MIQISSYDKHVHGHIDDCDYVILAPIESGLTGKLLAEEVCQRMGYEVRNPYETEKGNEYALCHA